MKRLFLVLTMVALTFGMNAQVSPKTAQLIVDGVNEAVDSLKEKEKDSLFVSDVDIFIDAVAKQPRLQVLKVVDTEKRRVVNVPGKTADEIYTMVEIAVAKFWKNPDEVIEGRSQGRYIKIRGGGSNVHFNSIGTIYTYSTIASYMIQFKDGKFMYTIGYETRYPASQYSTGGLYPTAIKTHRKNGKPIKLAISDIQLINIGVNSFINTILESDPESGIDSDW